jgi:hypothetical protein
MDFVFTAKTNQVQTLSRFKECPEGSESVHRSFVAIISIEGNPTYNTVPAL